jgi:hypothetical protein
VLFEEGNQQLIDLLCLLLLDEMATVLENNYIRQIRNTLFEVIFKKVLAVRKLEHQIVVPRCEERFGRHPSSCSQLVGFVNAVEPVEAARPPGPLLSLHVALQVEVHGDCFSGMGHASINSFPSGAISNSREHPSREYSAGRLRLSIRSKSLSARPGS